MNTADIHPPKQSRSRRTLRRITQAALELIAEHGVDGTSVSAIVSRADSSVGSFYARFGSKDDLLVYIDESLWEEAEARWDQMTADHWADRGIPDLVPALARIYAELESQHRAARIALAQALRGPAAGPSESAVRFKGKILNDSRRFLLGRSSDIQHRDPHLAVETTCRALEACALSLDATVRADLCAALVQHLIGEGSASATSSEVEFFDVWG